MIYITSILGYILGSIPFAFILVKMVIKKDILIEGTGNVGAMNSYEISGKKWIGFGVFFLDAIKGLAAVLLADIITNNNVYGISLAGAFAIIGHNYSVFLKFKGGRGLATAVGVLVLISPITVLTWLIIWEIGFYLLGKDIHTGNLLATILTPVVAFFYPASMLNYLFCIGYSDIDLLRYFIIAVCFLIFIKHLGPLKDLLSQKFLHKNLR
jgi:acyl phosphate:glycerol-3-phosphate acyltransferase